MPDDLFATDLREIAASLRTLSKSADGALLNVGDRLGAAVDTFAQLTALFEALPRELETEELRHAADRLEEVAQEVKGIGASLADEGDALSRLAALNREVGARVERLRRTVGTITVLAVNARIAAAHIDDRGEDFSVFTREIARLASGAEAAIRGYAEEQAKLAGLLRSAGETQTAFRRSHEGTLGSVAQQLEANVRAVDSHRAQAAAAAGEIGSRSKRVGQEIGAVVMALQVGDITRQRAEHVVHALDLLGTGTAAGVSGATAASSWHSALTEAQVQSVAGAVCRLQSAQIMHAADEFDGEIRRIGDSMKRLADDARAIVRLGDEMYGTHDGQGTSFLADLESKLALTGALLRDCRAARAEVDRIAAAVVATLAALLDRVRSVRRIEVDMRLVGLNTALRCGRLGDEGRALSVIAQELRGYANQTVEDANALVSVLQETVASAERFERERRGQGAERIALLERDMADALSTFQASGGRLNDALAILSREGEQVGQVLADTAASIRVHGDVGPALHTAGDRLGDIAGTMASPVQDAGLVTERLRWFGADRYTMASEREIHERIAAALVGARGGCDTSETRLVSLSRSDEALLEDVLF